jgi:hypothetical protein
MNADLKRDASLGTVLDVPEEVAQVLKKDVLAIGEATVGQFRLCHL